MNNIELDDLKAIWQTLNHNLEQQHALAARQLRESKSTRLRAGFRLLVFGQIIQIICGALLALFAANFWVAHLRVPHLAIYGVSLHLYGILLIVFAARDLFLIKRFDFAAPVLVLQKQIAALRSWHHRAAIWFGVTSCFVWIPLLLILFYSLGADLWRHDPAVVGWLLLSGVVSLGILLGAIAFSRRPGRERFARGLASSSAGSSVNRAQSLIDEVEAFEKEGNL